MRLTPLPLRCLAAVLLSATAARATEAPRPWAADAFLPVTEDRIAALPSAAQPAWQSYWGRSQQYATLLSARDLVDHSATKPLVGPPLGSSYSQGVKLNAAPAWYATEEARVIADRVVNWQTAVGAWTKSGDYSRNRLPSDDHHDAWSGGTYDNDSTINELRYLALVLHATEPLDRMTPRAEAWGNSFLRGLKYVFDSQYPSGGFPQVYPLVGWYHDAITINDDALLHVLELLQGIGSGQAEYAFVPPDQATQARRRFAAGMHCLLAAQLKGPDGQLTVWCQQHDPITLAPCAARNFEPIAECSRESVALTEFLMKQPQPSPEIIAAVNGAMAWFEHHALHGVHWDHNAPAGTGLESKPGAPDLWARYYEIGTGKPIFGERDRTIHYTPAELSFERRKGYQWFNSAANALFPLYASWKKSLPQ
jgi:PelA/Pel-15E family pectate lyase